MEINLKLKLKIIEKFGSQIHFARVSGVDESKVSKVMRGWRTLTPLEQKKWANVLGCRVKEIFQV
jgi:hypothetical protein